jgi:anaerobic C4-dicarboxylate transporter
MIFLQLAVLLLCIFMGSRIGTYVLDHSFMLPGIITTAAAVIAGLILQSFLL